MWIEAILTARDCADFIGSITPLKVDLDGPERVLLIGRPKCIELVPKKGLRLSAAGHVVWTFAGVKVPITVRVGSMLLTPSIEPKRGRDALCFRARIEKLDVKVLPQLIDETVVHRINDTLAKHDDALVWRFAEKLDYHWALPKQIESADAVDVKVRWGQVKVTAEALVLAMSFDVHAVRHGTRSVAHAAE